MIGEISPSGPPVLRFTRILASPSFQASVGWFLIVLGTLYSGGVVFGFIALTGQHAFDDPHWAKVMPGRMFWFALFHVLVFIAPPAFFAAILTPRFHTSPKRWYAALVAILAPLELWLIGWSLKHALWPHDCPWHGYQSKPSLCLASRAAYAAVFLYPPACLAIHALTARWARWRIEQPQSSLDFCPSVPGRPE